MKLANSTGQGSRNAITTKHTAITMPPPAISRFSPIWLSSHETTSV